MKVQLRLLSLRKRSQPVNEPIADVEKRETKEKPLPDAPNRILKMGLGAKFAEWLDLN